MGYDRLIKVPLYAKNRIAEFWKVDVVGQCIEVRRNPRDGEYLELIEVRAQGSASPLAFPDLCIDWSALFGG